MSQNELGEEIVLVDENDNPIGFETKLKAHEDGGRLHRAFSVFIFDGAGKMLLQRRAKTKYHFGGLWTNACCSHPTRGEELRDAVRARLHQEFGFRTELQELFGFVYRAPDARSGLTEYEFDHVFWLCRLLGEMSFPSSKRSNVRFQAANILALSSSNPARP